MPHGWFGDSFVKLDAKTLTPFAFTPDGAATMEANDVDLGAGGTLVVPNSHLVIGGGKTGYMYLMNRDSMSLVQQLTAATNVYHPELRDQDWDVGPHLHGSPNFWRGPDPTYGYLYVWGEKDALHQYSFNTQTNQFDTTRVRSGNIVGNPVNMPGGMISISSNGNNAGTGVVWATMPTPEISQPSPGMNTTPGHLYAYNAETVELLWDKHFSDLSPMGTWVEPTIAGGNVFVGTSANELIAYELGPASGAPRQRSVSQGSRSPEPLIPLRQRYSDEASVRRLPGMALKQLEPGPGYAVSLALRGAGELLYRSATNGVWQLTGASAELWKLDPEDPSARKSALVRLGNGNTWTASDGSSIVVEVQKTVPSPDSTAASWTLFRVSAHRANGILTDVAYVQCIFTQEGLPPAKRSVGLGQIQRVPYEANYVFYSQH